MILRKFLCSATALAVSLAIVYNSGESLITCLIGGELMYLSGYVLLVEAMDLIKETSHTKKNSPASDQTKRD